MPSLAVALLVAALAGPGGDERDVVHLQDGTAVRGRVVLETEDAVVVRIGSRERRLPRERVAAVESVARNHRALCERLRGLDWQDVGSLVELLERCQEWRLGHEARLFAWAVLLVDPQHDGANELLGHRRGRDGWRIPLGSGAASLAEVEAARRDWAQAWELRSEHFALRCDRGLRAAIHILLELEGFYHAFYELWQRDLELRELLRPVQCFVYGDRERFPNLSNTAGAWFGGDENVLYTWIGDDGRAFALFHEATHAVLYNLAGGAQRGRGRVPPWLDEALAEHMETVVAVDSRGCARLHRGRVHDGHLRTVRSAQDPYTVQRILNFNSSDFSASSKQRLKYAQSYALLHFMLHGEGGRLRASFLEYMREALAGRGQASTFRRRFLRDLDAIERGHRAGG